MKKQEKRSPIKQKSLRYAGQSLDERIDALLNENALPYFIAAALVMAMAASEWWRFYQDSPPSPKTMTVFALCVVAYCIYKIRKILREVKSLRLGMDGEKEVGETLDELRESGCKILHDITGENFNLDHVIISTKGIYVVETKTYSKPARGDAHVEYDGEKITIPCRRYGSNAPIIQTLAASKWLRELLQKMTGKQFSVYPVVVFPGWFITQTQEARKAKVWVLNPKALVTILNRQQNSVTQTDVSLIHYHLAQYVRAKAGTTV